MDSSAAVVIQRHFRGYRTRRAYNQRLIEKLITEQEEMFEEQSRWIDGQLFSGLKTTEDPLYVTAKGFSMPLGYKYQIAALRI